MTDVAEIDLRSIRADLSALKVIVHEIDRKISPPPKLGQPGVRAICDALERAGWESAPKTERRERT